MKSFTNTIKLINKKGGYTLLFAVIVSVLVLSIAAFILSISRKQAILSASARDSEYAFYAADSGLECAIENLAKLSAPINNTTSGTIDCGVNNSTNNNPISFTGSGGASAGTTTFSMLTGTGNSFSGGNSDQSNQSGAASCASTSVAYVVTPATYDTNNGNVLTATSTTITVFTRGYNIGWNGTNCSLTGPRKVERALQYTQY